MTSRPASAEWSAEFAFVCACAAPGASRPADDALDVLDALDAELVAAIAYRHQVVPLVVAAYRRSRRPIPSALAARHAPIAPLLAAREAIRLRMLFEARGITPLFLKGSTLAMLAYGALEQRWFGDIDMLVRPDEAERAASLLGEAGYRVKGTPADGLAARVARLSPLAKDIALRHSAADHVVELHWRMTDNIRERPARDHEVVQHVELAAGAWLPTLGTEALFAYLCGHGAAHLWARLRWLADIAALLARESDGGDRLLHAARARGQGVAAASAILLAKRYFGMPVPPTFLPPASLRLRLLVHASRRAIEAGGGTLDLADTRWRGWAEMMAKLLVASHAGDLMGWTTRLLFSVSDEESLGTTRLWYIFYPLQRIPKLIERRRRRRHRKPG